MADTHPQSDAYREADTIAAELVADMGDAHGAHLPMTMLARAYLALRSETAAGPRAVAEECVRMVREYDDQSETGDVLTQLAENMAAYAASLQAEHTGECICPKCGLRHGGSNVKDAGF